MGLSVGTSEMTAGLAAFALSLLLTPVALLALGRLGVLDHPNARSSHDKPIVRGGGIALAIASVAAWALAADAGDGETMGLGVVVAAAAFGAIGLTEDIRGVPAGPRFALQLIASVGACVWLLEGLEGPAVWQVVFGGGALVWLIAYVNGFNFMDGINGISAVQSVVVGVTWAWLGHTQGVDVLAWGGQILAGAALAFLPFNFPQARIFLGDAGSYFIGGWQAALLVVGFRSGIPPEAMLAPLALYLADTGLTLSRRVVGGDSWHEPHREHTYQRLVRRGWSHARTTGVVGGFVVICALLGLGSLTRLPIRVAAGLVLVAALVSYLALPAWTSRRSTDAAGVS